MTPLELARSECANFRPTDGSPSHCLLHDQLAYRVAPIRCIRNRAYHLSQAPCRLTANDFPPRCVYFEESVLPACLYKRIDDPALALAYAHAAYPKASQRPPAKLAHLLDRSKLALKRSTRLCPACNQAPLLPRRRLCDACATAKRRATKRAHARASRTQTIPNPIPTQSIPEMSPVHS